MKYDVFEKTFCYGSVDLTKSFHGVDYSMILITGDYSISSTEEMTDQLSEQFIVIRIYQPGDELECSKLIHEGVMSTVRPSFFTALTREVTFQIVITMAAVMFVFIGLSPTICMTAIPSTILFIYLCVYVSHLKRASDLMAEAMNISKHFMSSKYTCFWVAEAYEPYCLKKSPSQLLYSIYRESQLDFRLQEDGIYSKKIIGTLGINRCDVMHESAWLRRMNVNSKYHRKGIATAMLNEAIDFCKKKGYESIELVTSECHDGARKMYLKNGFKLRQLYHKPIIGTFVQVLMYQFTFAIQENDPEKKIH